MAGRGVVDFTDNADFVPLERKKPAAAPKQDRVKKEKKKKPRKVDDGSLKRRSLFVTGLPEDATTEMVPLAQDLRFSSLGQLEAAFGDVGPLRSCFVVCEKGGERVCKGYGFVTYSLDADAERAIGHFKKERFMNKRLVVDYAKPRERGVREGGPGEPLEIVGGPEPTKLKSKPPAAAKPKAAPKPRREPQPKKVQNPKIWRLIVRNLGWKVKAKDLEDAFGKHGKVSEATLVKDANGRSRGFAFVQLDSKEAANKAMQKLNGAAIGGRAVAVDWALAKSAFMQASADKRESEKEEPEDDEAAEEEEEGKKKKRKSNKEDKKQKDDDEEIEYVDEDADEEEGEEKEEIEDKDAVKEEDEDEAEDPEESEKKFQKGLNHISKPSDVGEGRTVFVRNLLFSTTGDEVKQRFAEFGEIKYCLLVTDHSTGLSRGSAFVQFKDKEAIDAVMREAYPYGRKQLNAKRDRRMPSKSVLDGVSELLVHGRPVIVDLAVERGKAAQLKEQNVRQKDKRNLYLLNEGVIEAGTPAADGVSEADIAKRQQGASGAKRKLTNPNFFVSRERLAVRNLPKDFSEKQLRELFINAAASGNTEGPKPRIVQAKISRDEERKTGSEGSAKSRGFGFVEFSDHTHAITALRKLNNNAKVFTNDARPIVTFAVENRLQLKKREERQQLQPRSESDAHTPKEQKANGDRKRKELEGGAVAKKGGKKNDEQNKKKKNEGPKQKQGGSVVGVKDANTKRQRDDGAAATRKQAKHNVEQLKRGKEQNDPIAAALKAARNDDTQPKKERLTKAKKAKQDDDKFDELVERYKQRTQGVNTDGWL